MVMAVVMIAIGLIRPSESYIGIVGFLFLFFLSMIMLNGNVQYETGANTTSSFVYNATSGQLLSSRQIVDYNTAYFSDDTSHKMGFYLVVVSIVGFAGVLFSLRSHWKSEREQD